MASLSREYEQKIIASIHEQGQSQILRYWDELSDPEKSHLLQQIALLDLTLINKLKTQLLSGNPQNSLETELEPVEIVKLTKSDADKKRRQDALQVGETALTNGQVAALLVAGGQGTRLGFNGPKGILLAGTNSKKSLFQLYAEKILALNRKYSTNIPWYIMTSEVNHQTTIDFFSNHAYFGLNDEDIFFFKQGMLPALDEKGQIILDAKNHIFTSPNGHGGVLLALRDNGALADMKTRGIKQVFYFQIDNILINICDPVFIGLHLQEKAEMSAKIVSKRDPHEKVGIIGRMNGKVQVIEYSDLSPEEMEARQPDGSLKYNGGSIAIHCFNFDFLEREIKNEIRLPFHIAHKKVSFLDEHGNLIHPTKPNAYKFEMFIFDALQDAARTLIMEVNREEEFSPIKNKAGKDTLATAQRDLTRFFGQWLEDAGVEFPKDDQNYPKIDIEISSLIALNKEDLKKTALPKRLENNIYLGKELIVYSQ